MNKFRDHSDQLTIELLQKYRDGTLSSEEEARLKALRAQDPWVADALEGVAIASDGKTFSSDVAILRARLQERTRQRRHISDYVLRVAASLVILLVASYLIYSYILAPEPTPVANEIAAPAPAATQESFGLLSQPLPIASLPPATLVEAPPPEKREAPPSLALIQPPSVTSEPSPQSIIPPGNLAEMEAEALDEKSTSIEKLPTVKKEQYADVAPNTKMRSSASVSPALEVSAKSWRTITGQVVDQKSEDPLPGVNVLVEDTTLGTITDIDGRFVLSLPAKYDQLQFSTIGFESQTVAINQQDSAYVALAQDLQSLSEIVVTGYGSAETASEVITTSAKPRQGMRAFKRYLSNNLRYPHGWQENDKKTVKIAFLVQPDGTLTDFAVEKSAGAWFDQEAIRLIREGPDWDAAKKSGRSVAQRIRVKVRFQQ